MSELLGQQLSNYKLTRLLSHGTLADTYLGEHVRMKAPATIVILHVSLAGNQNGTFQEMAQRIASLIHLHIVRTIDCDLYNKTPFLIQEYFPSSLRQLYPEGTQLPLNSVVTYVRQAASALQHAHDLGIIHGDLRPQYMQLRERDKSLLLNGFGLSILMPAFFPQVVSDNPYLAPELPQQALQPASDQYSLAAIAYEWLGGASSALPDEVDQVLNTARASEPGQRFATIRAFATALEQASKNGIPVQPPVKQIPVASSVTISSVPTSVIPQPDPLLLSHSQQPPKADASLIAPNTSPHMSPHKAISRRTLLVSLVAGGTVAAGGVVAATIVRNVLPKQLTKFKSPPSPPKIIYIHQNQGKYTSLSGYFQLLWSPDNIRIATTDYDSYILQAWDAFDEGRPIIWIIPQNSQYAFQWSQKTLFAAWSMGLDGVIHVRDITNARDISTYTGHSSKSVLGDEKMDIAFSPDGKRIASLKYVMDGIILVWDVATATTICTIATNDSGTEAVLWSPNGRQILSWNHSTLYVWDAQTGNPITSFGKDLASAPAWSPNSQYIASAFGRPDNLVMNVYNAQNGQLVCSYKGLQKQNFIPTFAWSPDSKMIASVGQEDNNVYVWNASTGKLISTHESASGSYVAWSPDSIYIASQGPVDLSSRSFQVWNAASGENTINYNLSTFRGAEAATVVWSPNGQFIAAVDQGDGDNSAVYIWRPGQVNSRS